MLPGFCILAWCARVRVFLQYRKWVETETLPLLYAHSWVMKRVADCKARSWTIWTLWEEMATAVSSSCVYHFYFHPSKNPPTLSIYHNHLSFQPNSSYVFILLHAYLICKCRSLVVNRARLPSKHLPITWTLLNKEYCGLALNSEQTCSVPKITSGNPRNGVPSLDAQ